MCVICQTAYSMLHQGDGVAANDLHEAFQAAIRNHTTATTGDTVKAALCVILNAAVTAPQPEMAMRVYYKLGEELFKVAMQANAELKNVNLTTKH